MKKKQKIKAKDQPPFAPQKTSPNGGSLSFAKAQPHYYQSIQWRNKILRK